MFLHPACSTCLYISLFCLDENKLKLLLNRFVLFVFFPGDVSLFLIDFHYVFLQQA